MPRPILAAVPRRSPAVDTIGPVPEPAPTAIRPIDPAPTPQRLTENRDFLVVLTSQGISSLGDAVNFTALPLLVLALTGSGLAMGVVGAVATLPDLFIALFAGAIADRADRRRMMLLADAGRCVLTALIPISVALDGPTLAVILLVAAPLGILRAFFLAGYTASLPALVGRSQLTQANAVFEAVYSAGFIIGPALAGFLATSIGPGRTLVVDALSFGLSAIALLFIRRPLVAPQGRPSSGIIADIREGIVYVVHDRVLAPAILFWGSASVVGAGIVNVLAYLITVDRAYPASVLGLTLTAYGVGTVSGALLAARLRRGPSGVLMLGGIAAKGALLLAFAASSEPAVGYAAALGAGVFDSIVLVTYITLRTNLSPDELLGRIGATARTISLGLQPVGLFAAGVLLDSIGGEATLVVMGVAFLALGAGFAFVPALRGVRLSRVRPAM